MTTSCDLFVDEDGKRIVTSLEYGMITLLGTNLEITFLDDIANMGFRCSDFGLDTIETRVTFGIAVEVRVISFGDAKSAMKMIEEIAKGSRIGKVLSKRVLTAGRVFAPFQKSMCQGIDCPCL